MFLSREQSKRSLHQRDHVCCQEQVLHWGNWRFGEDGRRLLGFVEQLIQFRVEFPTLHQRAFFHGRTTSSRALQAVGWYGPTGWLLDEDEWDDLPACCLGIRVSGQMLAEGDIPCSCADDDTVLILFNAQSAGVLFRLPTDHTEYWEVLLDTAVQEGQAPLGCNAGAFYHLQSRSIVLLKAAVL